MVGKENITHKYSGESKSYKWDQSVLHKKYEIRIGHLCMYEKNRKNKNVFIELASEHRTLESIKSAEKFYIL